MRKLIQLLPVFLILFIQIAYLSAQHVPPVRTLEIPFAGEGVVTIDGIPDYIYSAEQSTDAYNPTGSTGADADFTCSFRVCYNYQFLFLYVNILDDFDNSVEHTTTPNVWEYDCAEVFLDLDTNGSGTHPGYDDNTVQLRFSRGLWDSVQSPGRAQQEEYLYYFENTAYGWLLEAAIPWTCVLSNGQLPEDFMDYLDVAHGFDLSGSDSDTPGPGARDCQTAWDNDDPSDPADRTEDNAWNNRTVFGIVTLEGGSTPPPPPPPPGITYIEPLRNMNIPYTPYNMSVDGYDNELNWSTAQNLDIFNYSNWESEVDLRGSYRTAWDYEFLYIFAGITDDVNQSWDGTGIPSLYDNLEIYIDLDTLCSDIYYRSNSTTMLRFCRGVDEVETAGRAPTEDFQYSWRNKVQGGSWYLEAAIPWTAALAIGADPKDIENYLPIIGFDVIVNDRDTEIPSNRTQLSQAGWDLDESEDPGEIVEDYAYYNTRTFGIANLVSGGTEVNENLIGNGVTLYPVPAAQVINFSKLENVLILEIIDLNGKVLLTIENPEPDLSLDVSRFEKGIYIARYIRSDISGSLKFIVD